jgi:hypothetical protein
MTKPQQTELARSGRGEVDPAAAKTRRGGPTDETAPTGAIPEENLPGRRPEHDQDKPEGPPPRPRARQKKKKVDVIDLTDTPAQSFDFDFEPRMRPFSLAFGVTPWTTGVDVADGELRVRFGLWSLRTPLDNIAGAEVTGPYSLIKVVGPARFSLADRGLTFATSSRKGVCIRFKKPVAAVFPSSPLKHPGLTVTVEDPKSLAAALTAR